MSDWTDRLAEALGVPRLDAQQERALLRASRDIAHQVERKEAPLSSYLLGVAVGTGTARGTDPAGALKAALDATLALLGPEPLASDGGP